MNNFNKAFLSLFVCVFTCFQGNAQLKIGFKTGANISNVHVNYGDFNTEKRVGYLIGGVVDYSFDKHFGLQTGLSLSSKGTYQNMDLEGVITKAEGHNIVRMNYIDFPVHGVFKVNKHFQLYAGPYLAFGVGGQRVWDYTFTSPGVQIDTEGRVPLAPIQDKVEEADPLFLLGEDAYHDFDYGLNAGLGLQFGPILINAGYSLGLGNFLAEADNRKRSDFNGQNRVINISVSYFFEELSLKK